MNGAEISYYTAGCCRTELDQPRYLLIFVTATILKESGEFLVYDNEPRETKPSPPAK